MVRLASVLRPRVQSLTVFSFFFTFHNFFFAFALPEKFAFGSKAQKKKMEVKPAELTLLGFAFFLFLCAFHFVFRARRCKGSSSALHNAMDGGKAHLDCGQGPSA